MVECGTMDVWWHPSLTGRVRIPDVGRAAPDDSASNDRFSGCVSLRHSSASAGASLSSVAEVVTAGG
eukprot:1185318-Prorocentrum_minimum.AAC.3